MWHHCHYHATIKGLCFFSVQMTAKHEEQGTKLNASASPMPVCAHISVLQSTSSSMQRRVFIGVCVRRGVGALPWWRGHRAKMSRESGKRAIWIINRDGRARPPACKSNKMLPLAEPSRCNVAMKAGYPSRREALEPRYGESKSKPTLPNINPCDGSIDSLCLCVYLGMYLCVCTWGREYVCGALDLHRDMRRYQWVLRAAHACAQISILSYGAFSDVM